MYFNLLFCLFTFTITASSRDQEETTKNAHDRLKRIVGGRHSYGWRYPWYAILVRQDENHETYCGASLITLKHLITAAHCFDLPIKLGISVVGFYSVNFGVYNDCVPEVRRQSFKPYKIIIHKSYFDPFIDLSGDIAIIVLERPAFGFEQIGLPNGIGFSTNPNAATVIGFGYSFSKSKDTVCVMQEVNVKIFTKAQCINTLNNRHFNRKDTLCAGILEGGSDACQGDSGGPLQISNELGATFIVGIVSYGTDCALPFHPGIYTNVSYHLNWILKNII